MGRLHFILRPAKYGNVFTHSIASSRDDLTRGRTYTDTRTIADSIDIILEEHETRSDKKSMSESLGGTSRSSSGFLQIQANLAAHSALARPQSGMDLIEDMKNAAAVFGKMFGDDLKRGKNLCNDQIDFKYLSMKIFS